MKQLVVLKDSFQNSVNREKPVERMLESLPAVVSDQRDAQVRADVANRRPKNDKALFVRFDGAVEEEQISDRDHNHAARIFDGQENDKFLTYIICAAIPQNANKLSKCM